MLRSSADRQLYVNEFHTEGALTLKAFADNASVVLGTVGSSCSDDRNIRVRAGFSRIITDKQERLGSSDCHTCTNSGPIYLFILL